MPRHRTKPGGAPDVQERYRAHACPVKAAPAPTLSVVPHMTIVGRRYACTPSKGPGDAICSAEEREMTDVPETRWARTVDGACIAYQDIGEGPVTLIVVHGWVSHLEVYWEQPRYVRFLRRLSRNMRVLVFDKRGIGMSDRVGRITGPRHPARRRARRDGRRGRRTERPCWAGEGPGRSSRRSSRRHTRSVPCVSRPRRPPRSRGA